MRLSVGMFDRRPITRWVAVFLLAVEAIFLNVIVPGHTRGVITLSGKCSCSGLADLGCPLCAHRVSDDPKKAPTSQDRCDCAICHLAVCMMSTPPVDLGLGELGLLKLISPPASEEITIAARVRTYDGRGPPPASL